VFIQRHCEIKFELKIYLFGELDYFKILAKMCKIKEWFSILKEGVKAQFFSCLTPLSDTYLCFKKMLYFPLYKMFVLTTTLKPFGTDNCVALRYDKRKNRTQSLLEANPITLFAVGLDLFFVS